MKVLVVAAAWLIAGCAPAPLASLLRVEAAQGYSLSFPGPVRTRAGREGPVRFRIDQARTADGARFECAWFGFPEPLSAPERADLLSRVEKGLARDPGTQVVSRVLAPAAEREGVDLVLDRADGRRGFHRVFYPGPHAMLQVSVVGPRGGEWEREVPRFWSSVTFSREPVPAEPPSVWQAAR